MTNGVVSITDGGKTIMKIVTGQDGMFAENFAKVLKHLCEHRGLPSEEGAIEWAESAGFGKNAPSLTAISVTRIVNLVDGDVSNDPMYARYRETFHIPQDNPRWECGISSYVYFVDLVSGNVVRICSERTE
jgi:hypothetical protein